MNQTGSDPIRIGIIGCGFWANYQLAGWQELPGVEVVAVCDADGQKARSMADQFGVARTYTDAETLLATGMLDVVDVITPPSTHAELVRLAVDRRVPVITQKPMATDLPMSEGIVNQCREAGVPLFVHENFRWQTSIRALRQILDSGEIGKPFKATISFCTGFPVFANQPLLASVEQLIISDLGSHMYDVCRFLFGEPTLLFCRTARLDPTIRGEDVANTLIQTETGVHCYVAMSFASVLETDAFPETLVTVEADAGSVELRKGFELRITTRLGGARSGLTRVEYARPPLYPWAHPDYAVVHASIVDCNRNLLGALRPDSPANNAVGRTSVAETTGEDNLRTVRMVQAAYESAATGQAVKL